MPSRRRPRGAMVRVGCVVLAVLAGGCSGGKGEFGQVKFSIPQTSVSYTAKLKGAPSSDVASLAKQSLDTWRYMKKGAASIAFLRRRAENDVGTLIKILHSRGYYSAKVETAVEMPAPKAASAKTSNKASAKASGKKPGKAQVIFTIEPGPAYTLTRQVFDVTHQGPVAPPALDAAKLGSPVGKQARAAAIVGAEAAAVAKLKRSGFAYAEFKGRNGVANPKAATLEVTSHIDAGRAYTFGDLTFDGVHSVKPSYLRTYVPWSPGATYDAKKLRTYQKRLFDTGLFDAVSVLPPAKPPATGPANGKTPPPLPLTVKANDRPPRTISGSLRYDTDVGPSAQASFEHRNLFGRNEHLLVQAQGGLVEQTVGIGLRKPQYLQPQQDLVGDLTFTHTNDQAYKAMIVSLSGGLERKVGERWKGGLKGLIEASRINDNGDKGEALLFGTPFFLDYDGSNNLLNPTTGGRYRLEATPFAGVFENRLTKFLVIDNKGSYYLPLDKKRTYVLAARARAATIISSDLQSIPATHRLYAGGGGSVRGYQDRFVGPLDKNGDPIGGRSALEGSLEFRAHLFGNFGGVIFTDAGAVSTQMYPDFSAGVQVAAGVGLRYHTIAGPVRVDLAFPLNPRGADNPFEVYFSIGQAF